MIDRSSTLKVLYAADCISNASSCNISCQLRTFSKDSSEDGNAVYIQVDIMNWNISAELQPLSITLPMDSNVCQELQVDRFKIDISL